MTQPDKNLFRQEALQHYLQVDRGKEIVRISPLWTWTLIVVLTSLLITALMVSFVGIVEINGRGRGIVRPSAGIRTLVSQTSGTVNTIEVRSGQAVEYGTVLLRINVPHIQSEILRAQRQIEVVTNDFKKIIIRQEQAYKKQARQLKNRITLLQEQLVSHQRSLPVYEKRLSSRLILEKDSIISSMEVDAAREDLAQAQRQVRSAQQVLDQTLQEQAALESNRQDVIWQTDQIIRNAVTKRDALALIKKQTEIIALEDGIVEAMLVKPGEVIQAGQAVGKLIPQGSPLHVISFLFEKDRAFVKKGDSVHLELDQLPYSEFGTLGAKVLRISDDLASPFEIEEALGKNKIIEIPTFRVELEITDESALAKVQKRLRVGMMMNVRYTLRKQRLISIVFDPLRRWFK